MDPYANVQGNPLRAISPMACSTQPAPLKTAVIMDAWNRTNAAMRDLHEAVEELYQPPQGNSVGGSVPIGPASGCVPVNEVLRDLPKMLEELRMSINGEVIRIRKLNVTE